MHEEFRPSCLKRQIYSKASVPRISVELVKDHDTVHTGNCVLFEKLLKQDIAFASD